MLFSIIFKIYSIITALPVTWSQCLWQNFNISWKLVIFFFIQFEKSIKSLKLQFNILGDGSLFRRIFKVDPVAQDFTLNRTKAAYVCEYRLVPYITNQLRKLIDSTPYYPVSLDGSYNGLVESEEMDFAIRVFNEEKSKSESQSVYFSSMQYSQRLNSAGEVKLIF